MKLWMFILAGCFITISLQAQTDQLFKDREQLFEEMNLSQDQIARIKQINKDLDPQYGAISRDQSLSGIEKSERKEALATRHSREIKRILTHDQIKVYREKYGNTSFEKLDDKISDEFDNRLDDLERNYEKRRSEIENNIHISDDEKKVQLDVLKEKYKRDKDDIKKDKDRIKDGFK